MKRIYFALIIVLISCYSSAQNIDSTALILIDIQDFYFPGGGAELVEPEKAAEQAGKVLSYFRENNGLVVHVAHKVKQGGDIRNSVAPKKGEKVVWKTEVSCFNGTDLHAYLQRRGIIDVVLVGMQTHMCLEGGTRAAYDLGYKCTVIADACATRDLKYADKTIKAADVHASTLATLKSYAKVLGSAQEYLHP